MLKNELLKEFKWVSPKKLRKLHKDFKKLKKVVIISKEWEVKAHIQGGIITIIEGLKIWEDEKIKLLIALNKWLQKYQEVINNKIIEMLDEAFKNQEGGIKDMFKDLLTNNINYEK